MIPSSARQVPNSRRGVASKGARPLIVQDFEKFLDPIDGFSEALQASLRQAAQAGYQASRRFGGGLNLFVTPDESRTGDAAFEFWRMGYRFHSRQEIYSIGAYGDGKEAHPRTVDESEVW